MGTVLVDNTFENQSALKDENSGGAVADATGGSSAAPASSAGSKFSLDSAKASLMSALSMKPNGTLFKNGKFVFPNNLLKELKLDSLVNGIQDALAKGLSISQALQNGINGMLGSLLSQLMGDASDTWAFLQKAGGSFLQTLADKAKGLLLSRVYVPDVMFLAGLEPLKLIHSNISYKNDYVRKLCIKHDMPLSLAFVDNEIGIRYTMENNKGERDAISAAKYGAFNVSFYIMNKLYDEIVELKGCYPLPSNYDRDSQLEMQKRYQTWVDEAQKKIDALTALGTSNLILKPIVDELDKYKSMRNQLPINMEDKYKEDPNYEKIQTYIKKGNKSLCKIMKNVIVYSYSNLTANKMMSALKKYNINPSVFGTTDDEYGQCAKISPSDLNIMAPFYIPKKGNSLIGSATSAANKSTLVKDIAGKDKNDKFEVKFIIPRNVNVKSLYISLASKRINEKYMTNKPFYERMKYKVYDDLIRSLDSALSGLLDVGIGKTVVGALNSIEEAYYVYAKSLEPYLYNASKIEYISYNDLSLLPEPDEDEKKSTTSKSKNGGRADSKAKNNNANTAKAATGKTISSSLKLPFDETIDDMDPDDVNNVCLKYGIDTSHNLNDAQRRAALKKYFRENEIDYFDMIDVLSEKTLKKILLKNGYSEADLKGATKQALLSMMKKAMGKRVINYESGPSKINSNGLYYTLADDMRRYLRKYFNYKEYDLLGKTNQGLATLLTKSLFKERRNIYYTHEFSDDNGYDAEGFLILGYPDEDTIKSAIENNEIGYRSEYNPNGYPITSSGLICPIVGYNIRGKAMYGIPIFYPDVDPIGCDNRGCPVFAYLRDTALADDMNTTYAKIEKKISNNEEEINTYKRYINNGAQGKLKAEYNNKIDSKLKENEYLKEIISLIMIKPIIGYDEFGNKVYGELDPDKNIMTYDGINCIGYDTNKNMVFEITENGKIVIGYNDDNSYVYGSALISEFGKDKDDDIIYAYDTDCKPIYGFTKNKMCVMKRYDENEEKIFYLKNSEIKPYIGKTETGEPIFDYYIEGSVQAPIIGYDKNGNGIIYRYNSEENNKSKCLYYGEKLVEKIQRIEKIYKECVYVKDINDQNTINKIDEVNDIITESGFAKVYLDIKEIPKRITEFYDYINDELDKLTLYDINTVLSSYLTENYENKLDEAFANVNEMYESKNYSDQIRNTEDKLINFYKTNELAVYWIDDFYSNTIKNNFDQESIRVLEDYKDAYDKYYSSLKIQDESYISGRLHTNNLNLAKVARDKINNLLESDLFDDEDFKCKTFRYTKDGITTDYSYDKMVEPMNNIINKFDLYEQTLKDYENKVFDDYSSKNSDIYINAYELNTNLSKLVKYIINNLDTYEILLKRSYSNGNANSYINTCDKYLITLSNYINKKYDYDIRYEYVILNDMLITKPDMNVFTPPIFSKSNYEEQSKRFANASNFWYTLINTMKCDTGLCEKIKTSYDLNSEYNDFMSLYSQYTELFFSYLRLVADTPTPPVIGVSSLNGPIFGDSLIKTQMYNAIPELNYSSESAFDYGFVPSDNTSTSVLDKTDIDIDKEFAAAESELISNMTGETNIGRLLTYIVGTTEFIDE